VKRNHPKLSITLHPQALAYVERYRALRGVGRSTAISELLLFLIQRDECPANPAQIEQALSLLREDAAPRGLA